MKSKHKHIYSEDVIVRHWYRSHFRKSEVDAFVGMAKRCAVCGKVKYERFDWNMDDEKYILDNPQYQIVEDIPDHIRDEVIEHIKEKK
jgi:hypothetical protein